MFWMISERLQLALLLISQQAIGWISESVSKTVLPWVYLHSKQESFRPLHIKPSIFCFCRVTENLSLALPFTSGRTSVLWVAKAMCRRRFLLAAKRCFIHHHAVYLMKAQSHIIGKIVWRSVDSAVATVLLTALHIDIPIITNKNKRSIALPSQPSFLPLALFLHFSEPYIQQA